ncbi:hypothetical protein [Micromonospora sp. NPDC023814]|uniref:hypothetical protein n=1 Tax=Micromonospora sp. NPDC023814 TaxID=3154596 RepID=UPI0033F70814
MTTVDPILTAHDDPSNASAANATARHPAAEDARGTDAATRDASERLAPKSVAAVDSARTELLHDIGQATFAPLRVCCTDR